MNFCQIDYIKNEQMHNNWAYGEINEMLFVPMLQVKKEILDEIGISISPGT